MVSHCGLDVNEFIPLPLNLTGFVTNFGQWGISTTPEEAWKSTYAQPFLLANNSFAS